MWCFYYLKTTFILQMCLRRRGWGVCKPGRSGLNELHSSNLAQMRHERRLKVVRIYCAYHKGIHSSSRIGLGRLNYKIQHWQDTQIIILGDRIIQLGCFLKYKHKPFLFFNDCIKNVNESYVPWPGKPFFFSNKRYVHFLKRLGLSSR